MAVCLYVADVRRGVHLRYQAKGLPVYSAGDILDASFGDRFYEILRHFRYAMSNSVGSYAYYSVEMGIPFSLWGEKATYTRRRAPQASPNAPQTPPGAFHMPESSIGERIFSGLHTGITSEQKEFVEFSMGVGEGISGAELGRILRDAYRQRGRPVIDALTAARLRMKHGLQKLCYGID